MTHSNDLLHFLLVASGLTNSNPDLFDVVQLEGGLGYLCYPIYGTALILLRVR